MKIFFTELCRFEVCQYLYGKIQNYQGNEIRLQEPREQRQKREMQEMQVCSVQLSVLYCSVLCRHQAVTSARVGTAATTCPTQTTSVTVGTAGGGAAGAGTVGGGEAMAGPEEESRGPTNINAWTRLQISISS